MTSLRVAAGRPRILPARGGPLVVFLVVLVSSLAVVVIGASVAKAGVANFCVNSNAPSGWFCTGLERHSLTGASGTVWNGGGSNPGTCVSAQNQDGSQAGSWACGYPFSEHSYCGCQLRWPLLYVSSGVPESVTGAIQW
jgi:hypothetical protein